ncbi:hypothetical protein Pint_22888 [Pistacia integerrima]|uniref:Uncharacterized protein n=1 Tax=Pistacia integerrima TaxID=434235 RepID=A0ACC0YIX3_9ROSI|nr:hypothetical protein Pint_22888 [Pistacia integerrima]
MEAHAFFSRKPHSSLFTKLRNPLLVNQNIKLQPVRCQSQIKSFDNNNQPRRWSFEFLRQTEPLHVIQTSDSPVSMAATSASESASKAVKKVCLFFCPETKALAERIAAQSDAIELRSINWRTFDDGFPNLFIPNAHGIRGHHVAFLAAFSSPGKIFEQLSVIYALPKLFISSFTLVLPFFPTGTSERMEDEGDVATAFTLARILSNIPTSRGGPTSLVTFDIHALQERFYFGDNILPFFESGIPLLKNRLQQLPDSDNISIAFPDDGAWKRFHKQLQHFPMVLYIIYIKRIYDPADFFIKERKSDCVEGNCIIVFLMAPDFHNHLFCCRHTCIPHTVLQFYCITACYNCELGCYCMICHTIYMQIVCNKVREGDQRFVRIREGDPRGRHVVIVDDLVQSGGTLIECQMEKKHDWGRERNLAIGFLFLLKVLAAHGAAKISAYVTHGIFPNRSWQRFEPDNGGNPELGLTYFWITDSCPVTVREVVNKPPFEVLSLSSSIAAALQI